MAQEFTGNRLKKLMVVTSVAAIGVGTLFLPRSEKKSAPERDESSETVEIGETFAVLNEKIALSPQTSPTIHLGKMPLGAIREIKIETTGLDGGALSEVQSSCSCLQFGSLPQSGFDLNARYFAVGSGLIDLNIAVEQIDASGKSNILTFKMVGEVIPGDAARSKQLTEIIKTPPLSLGAADPQMLVSAKDAHLSVSSKRGLLIDVRSVDEYAREHAVGSLNVPIAELRASPAFRDREIFLIGSALLTNPMQKAVSRLKHQGLDQISIVNGGVLAWQVAGGKVFQELDPQPAIGSVTLDHLVQRVSPQDVTYCGIGLEDEFVFRYFFPHGQLVQAGANHVEMIEKQLAAAPASKLVLIDQTGKNYGSLNQNAPAHWLGRVYYVQAGFDEYLQEITRLSELSTAPLTQQISSVNGFARRDKHQRAKLPSSPGCGSCPK